MEHVLKDRGKKSFACNPPIQFLTVKQIIKLLILIFISFLAMQELCFCEGFSLVAANRGCSLAVVTGL